MRTRAVWATIAVATAVVLTTSPASAQFERQPSQAGPTLDSIRVMYQSRPLWRGFFLGLTAVLADVDVALAGYATTTVGDWALALRAGGLAIHDARGGAASNGHVEGGPVLSRRLAQRGDAASVELATSVYWLPDADTDASGVDVGLRLTRVQWSWGLEERKPTLGLGLHRDFGRFDGFRAEAAFDIGLGGQILALGPLAYFDGVDVGLEARGWGWEFDDDVPGRDRLGGSVGLFASFEKSWLAIVLRGGVMDPVDARGRGYFEAGLRIWPDGSTSGLPVG